MASNNMLTRDIKRRVGVIEKKIEDLQRWGVTCAFVYATCWTGGLYVCGDKRITDQIKSSASKFLETLEDTSEEDTKVLESKFCLPYLPGKLSELNGKTICSMLVGLGKDLKISWKDNPPAWWPSNVPYRHPRSSVPDGTRGQWTEQMKEVIQHLYAHYGITNIDEYVAAADQHATQTTKKSHDTPEKPPSSDPIPNNIPVSLDVDTSPGGETPLHHKKQPSPDPDATIDYILEEVNSLSLPISPLKPSPVKKKGKKRCIQEDYTPLAVRRPRRK